MTLQDYAKYLLNVCGKRFTHLYRRHYLDSTPALPSLSALLTYLRTQTASIYGYLQTRFAGDPTSGIPSITPTQPLTFANLLTNIQKLATRKIDAGASTQIPEGISLVRLLCDTTAVSAVTELIDTNTGWTMVSNVDAKFPNTTKLLLGCKEIHNAITSNNKLTSLSFPNLEKWIGSEGSDRTGISSLQYIDELSFPKLTHCYGNSVYASSSNYGFVCRCTGLKKVYMPELLLIGQITYPQFKIVCNCSEFEEFNAPKVETFQVAYLIGDCPNLKKVVLGTLKTDFVSAYGSYGENFLNSTTNLIHFEIGQGVAVSLHLNWWNPTNVLADTETKLPTFLTNFRQYLFLRLADRTATTALTLTLSSAVYTALTTETSTLAELGITTLTDKEQAAGITLATAYNTWLDTYRAAINWNITNAG